MKTRLSRPFPAITVRGLALVSLSLALVSCRPRPNHAHPAASPQYAIDLAGSWELDVRPPADNPSFRPWITVAIDSVTDGTLHGRLQHYLVGNVGIESDAFPHFDGQVTQGDTVRIAIRHADSTVAGLRFVGWAAGDTIRLDTLVVGPETLSTGGRTWMLIRRR